MLNKSNSTIHILSNKKGFIFDNINMCSKNPYLEKNENSIKLAFYIQNLEVNDNTIFIEGWSHGAPLFISGIPKSDYYLRRFNRDDVSNKLGEISTDAGFTLQFNLVNNRKINITLGDMEIDIFIDKKKGKIEETCEFKPDSDELLIVGGAPSVISYLEKIKEHKGDIWALNDAIFWLEDNKINVNNLLISDQRFVNKQKENLEKINCKSIISADYIDFNSLTNCSFEHFRVKILGRDGVSTKINEAYHGCTVANLALQIARLANYKSISTTGILLHFPTTYERIDGSKTMPEFVHKYQIKNIKKTMQKIRQDRITLNIYENNSNLNFF